MEKDKQNKKQDKKHDIRYGIVIPVYKKANCLDKCLKSIFDQQFKNYEVFVVFDGHDDAIKNFKDSKTFHVIETPHKGASHARNTGAKAAEAVGCDTLLFWDADCYMEPGALNDWANALSNPDIDFVYSDYRFTVAEMGGVSGYDFDPWLLKCNNYISTMSPVRTKCKPKFDESLESLQDWDLWLTLTKKGCKGKYLPGVKFVTEPPTPESISGKGCSKENWLERKKKVKQKHNIPDKDVCFTSLSDPERAREVAKKLGEDFSEMPSFNVHDYKMVYLLGFYAQDAIRHANAFKQGKEGLVKVIHWMGTDVDALYDNVNLRTSLNLGKVLKKGYVNFCESIKSQRMLKDIGIKADILKLPVDFNSKEMKKPEKFKVLYDADPMYEPYAQSLIRSLPDIEMEKFEGAIDMSEYSAFLRLSQSGILDNTCKKFLLSGRRVISNIPEAYAGYVGNLDIAVVTKRIVEKIRETQDTFGYTDNKAREYYEKILSWEHYKKTIEGLMIWKTKPTKTLIGHS